MTIDEVKQAMGAMFRVGDLVKIKEFSRIAEEYGTGEILDYLREPEEEIDVPNGWNHEGMTPCCGKVFEVKEAYNGYYYLKGDCGVERFVWDECVLEDAYSPIDESKLIINMSFDSLFE